MRIILSHDLNVSRLGYQLWYLKCPRFGRDPRSIPWGPGTLQNIMESGLLEPVYVRDPLCNVHCISTLTGIISLLRIRIPNLMHWQHLFQLGDPVDWLTTLKMLFKSLMGAQNLLLLRTCLSGQIKTDELGCYYGPPTYLKRLPYAWTPTSPLPAD